MKLARILKNWLLEKKGDKHDSNCTMLYFDFPELKEIQSKIDKDDIYEEEGDRSFGLEDEPHITLLYGTDSRVPAEKIQEILNDYTLGEGYLTNPSLFKKDEYEVLKFDIGGDGMDMLDHINEDLRNLPFENDQKYNPHSTIAYLKPGTGDKYVKKFEGLKFNFTPTKAVYSEANGKKTDIKINIDK